MHYSHRLPPLPEVTSGYYWLSQLPDFQMYRIYALFLLQLPSFQVYKSIGYALFLPVTGGRHSVTH